MRIAFATKGREITPHNWGVLFFSGTTLTYSRTPSMFGRLYLTKHVLKIRTEPQAGAKGRTQFWPRGKLCWYAFLPRV